MAQECSIFAWRIPWTEEHGGLQSMRSQRVNSVTTHKHTSLMKGKSEALRGQKKERNLGLPSQSGGLESPTAGDTVSIPGWGATIPQAQICQFIYINKVYFLWSFFFVHFEFSYISLQK